jgi:hypothetical protein
MTTLRRILLPLLCLCAAMPAIAGGPMIVGGPKFGVEGQPFTWAAMPINYRVDSGPLSATSSGTVVIDNATGIDRLHAIVANWQNVPTAAIAFKNAGPILAAGKFAGGDVKTADQFIAVFESCLAGTQTPVVFDADGSIVSDLGISPDALIGFNMPCKLDGTTGHISSALVLLNGRFQDGVNQQDNKELTAAQFDEAITHEFGHLLGLDHSQINVEVLPDLASGRPGQPRGNCSPDDVAGLPVMFPFAYCQARVSMGLPALSPDDQAWISLLYPQPTTTSNGKTAFASVYSKVSGTVYFSDGVNPAQGVNVIARAANDPLRTAFSVVSGFQFTANPGQSVTANYLQCSEPGMCPNGFLDDNTNGSDFGSRKIAKIGYYEIPVPAGSYTITLESVFDGFAGGSSVGPFDPPIPMPGQMDPAATNTVTVTTGTSSTLNFTLKGTLPATDALEGRLRRPALDVWLRREGGVA